MATSKIPYNPIGWKHLAQAGAGNQVQAVIPDSATEIMFTLFVPNVSVFSSKTFPKERISGSGIAVVYEGTSDTNNLFFGKFTCTNGVNLTYVTENVKWGGADCKYNCTADIYWK